MTDRVYNVLILCTGNSARSILAEAILNKDCAGRFRAYSAGSQPTGAVHPQALRMLEKLGHPTEGLRSKSWDEFAAAGAPPLDFIVTVCDNAAGEVCPVWPGKPVTAHWGIPDPAAAEGSEAEVALAFGEAYKQLSRRIALFLALPIGALTDQALRTHMLEISHMADTQDPTA